MPERFGNWNRIYKNFNRWAEQGVGAQVLEKAQAHAFILTPRQAADTSMMAATLEQIRVPVGRGRPRTRPDRVLADKGSPSKANRAWLRQRGIAATISERDDQIAQTRPPAITTPASA